MGVVAYYLHVDADQLTALREQPAMVWELQADPRFASARLADIDRDWGVVSWLVSPTKRREQEDWTVQAHVLEREGSDLLTMEQLEAALDRERRSMGVRRADKGSLPADLPLVAFEGRGTDAQRDEAFNFGLGGARVFSPGEVRELAAAPSFRRIRDFYLEAAKAGHYVVVLYQ